MADFPEIVRPLIELAPKYAFFVGIDSDGCAFDTMEIKHKECCIPNIIKHRDLQAVSKYAREAAEFVNLYSKWRGVNRWPALMMVFELLRERSEVQRRNAAIPEAHDIPRLRQNTNTTRDNVISIGMLARNSVIAYSRIETIRLGTNASTPR